MSIRRNSHVPEQEYVMFRLKPFQIFAAFIFISTYIVVADAQMGGAKAQGRTSSEIMAQRRLAYATFVKNFDALKLECGPQFSEGRTRAVWFPVNESQRFYTEDFGLHMAIQMVSGKPKRLWCMSEVDQRTTLHLQDHSGTYWKHLLAPKKVLLGHQTGMFPNWNVKLDGYLSFAQMAGVYRLDLNARAICSRGPVLVDGLSYPNITAPCERVSR